jgi:hypothetical protein
LLVVQLKLEQVLLVPQLLARGELGVRIDIGANPRVRERSLDRAALVGIDLSAAMTGMKREERSERLG